MTPNPKWQVTVQQPERFPFGASGGPTGEWVVPGYVQIDDVSPGNPWSKSPDSLRVFGYAVPRFDRLPTGRYSWAEACRMLERETEVNRA